MSIFSKYRFPIALALGLRLGLSFWLALVWIVIDPYFHLTNRMVREIYGSLAPAASLAGKALVDVWMRWDATHYMNIARQGYSGVSPGDLNYPPLYPYLALLFKPLAFGNEILSGLILSTLFSLAAFVLFYKLVVEAFQDTALARQTVLVLGIYPTSFFLFAPYTDSLFLALSLGFFLLLRARRWILAAALIALATLTRLQGILLILPLFIEVWRTKSITRTRLNPGALLSIGLAPAGYLLFEIWRRVYGLASFGTSFKVHSNIVFVDPFTGIWLALKQAFVTGDLLVISELLSVFLILSLLIWMLSRPKFRDQWPALVYGLALVILFMTKHSTAASAMQSSNRYVLGAFPAFIGLGDIVLNLPKQKRFIFKLTSAALLLIASACYALFVFVG